MKTGRKKLSAEERALRRKSHLNSLAIRRVVDSAFRSIRNKMQNRCGHSSMEPVSLTKVRWFDSDPTQIPTYNSKEDKEESLEAQERFYRCMELEQSLSLKLTKTKKES